MQKQVLQEKRLQKIEALVLQQAKDMRHVAEEVTASKKQRLEFADFGEHLRMLPGFRDEQDRMERHMQSLRLLVQQNQQDLYSTHRHQHKPGEQEVQTLRVLDEQFGRFHNIKQNMQKIQANLVRSKGMIISRVCVCSVLTSHVSRSKHVSGM